MLMFFLTEAVLTRTHNQCFGAKIMKIGIPWPCIHIFYYIKMGYILKGVYITQTCFRDVSNMYIPYI